MFTLKGLFTIDYSPHPDGRSFLERAQVQLKGAVQTTVAVPSDRESERIFGVRMARHGLQAVWIEVMNGGQEPLWLDRFKLDPNYYTPLEAANIARFAMGTRLMTFGVLGWLFLPLLALIPLKLLAARAANRRMDTLFGAVGFPTGVIQPGSRVSGFLFTPLDEGVKRVDVRLLGRTDALEFRFALEVPGLILAHRDVKASTSGEVIDFDRAALQAWLLKQPRCTGNAPGTVEGDPLNLVIVGDRARIQECLAAWDESESITFGTSWKTVRAFLLESQYRYSPVSPLYLAGREQDFALQRARFRLNRRLHLRLWATGVFFGGQPVWIGQASRDIGVRFTVRTWNLTTHQIDPNVDEARDYVLDNLLGTERVAQLGFIPGVQAAPPTAPRHNLTGDPYFTDGMRAFAVLSAERTTAAFVTWPFVPIPTCDEPDNNV